LVRAADAWLKRTGFTAARGGALRAAAPSGPHQNGEFSIVDRGAEESTPE
jgi:hypothetical protein